MVTFRDVTLRDGLQDEQPIATDQKLLIYEALLAAGVRDLELTSFVRPDRVPAMADAEAMCAATIGSPATRWGLVLNPRGVERAKAAGLTHFQYVISVSDSHSQHNSGRSTSDALVELSQIADLALAEGGKLEVTLSTSFGCPYEHRIDPERVVEVAKQCVDSGATAIGLADTIGVAVPNEVASLTAAVTKAVDATIGVHLHDTRGLAIANAMAAIAEGVDRVDGSLGGLGGCPFAPGASGNLALEDLVHGLEESGVDTGLSVHHLVEAARLACGLVGVPVSSHVGVAGPRFV